MIRLEIDGRQYPVGTEGLVLGSGDGCSILLTQEDVLPRHALVTAMSDGSVAVRSAATIAANAIPIPRASVAMCPLSEINANDPVRNPATSSTPMNTTTSANAIDSGRR